MHFGAWTAWDPTSRPRPAYRMFIPNLLAGAVAADNVALHMWVRATNASLLIRPSAVPLDREGFGALLQRRLGTLPRRKRPN